MNDIKPYINEHKVGTDCLCLVHVEANILNSLNNFLYDSFIILTINLLKAEAKETDMKVYGDGIKK